MKKLLQNKTALFAVLGLILGIVLIFLGTSNGDNGTAFADNSPKYSSKELESYTKTLEDKMKSMIERIGGVSNVSVAITIDGSIESVYATEGINKDYVIIKDSGGGENALQIMEINATVRGIAVVCDYGGNEKLKSEIITMLSSLFNIGANRVSVISA